MFEEKEVKKGKFVPIKVTELEEMKKGKIELPESDLSIQTDTHIMQYEFKEPDSDSAKFIIKNGSFNFINTPAGLQLAKFKLKEIELLDTIVNTSIIMSETNKFFNRLDIYEKLGRDPKRALLLCSKPGMGKTATINKVCKTFLEQESPDTAVVVWDTSDIRSSNVNNFFLNNSDFSPNVKRLILIIEDIGGGSVDNYDSYSTKGADSALLNLLDGVGNPFKKVPTFILATTNNPETSVEALIDRPGRFDKVIELKAPSKDECKELYKFILKTDRLDPSTIEAAKKASDNEFSIAHVQESVVRSMLDDITIEEAVDELIKHKERFKDAFDQSALAKKGERKIGFGS